ncbi:hypothetical protein ACFLTY_02105 [Chloroflexota bacterium]
MVSRFGNRFHIVFVLAVILTIISAGISGVAFVTGLISMIEPKERSVLVFVGMAIGLYCLIGAAASLITGFGQI